MCPLSITKVLVSEAAILVTPTAAPDVTGLSAVGVMRGVQFSWDFEYIGPFWYSYRTKVSSGAWSAWADAPASAILRMLTDAEVTAYGVVATIYFEVRSTNGLVNGTTAAINEMCLAIFIQSTDLGEIGIGALATTVTDLMFTSSARSADDLTVGVTNKLLTANEKTGAGYAYSFLDATGLKGTANIGATLASTVVSNAANGQTAYTKVAAEVGANTIETTIGSQSKVDTRLSSAEKANLEGALGVTLTLLSSAGDDILSIGTHENLVANKVAIKTSLDLINVENKSSATIRSETVDGDLTATTVVLKAVVITAINASVEATKIAKAQIATAKASSLQPDAATTALFDSSGRFLGTIWDTGSGVGITAASLILANNPTGQSRQLDLTSIAAGNLDNISDGATYVKTTTNQGTGATRAFAALNSSDELTTGTTNKTVAEIEAGLVTDYAIFSDGTINVSGVGDYKVSTLTGSG